MKFSCIQEDMKRGLATVGRVVSTRSTLPITQNVLISAEGAMVRLSTTDLNMAMTTWIAASVEAEGAITVPAKLLSDFVNTLPSEPVEIEMKKKPVGIKVSCASFEANISGVTADDFPPIPSVDEGVAASIETDVLREAISRVAFAAAVEDSRPVLTGVNVEITGDKFNFAAADGYRLAVYNGEMAEPVAEDLDFLVPAKAMSEINRLLPGHEGAVELTVTASNNQAMCRVGNVEVVCTLIAGAFPSYKQLIPTGCTTESRINTDEFLRAAKSAAIFARGNAGIIRLMIGGDAEAGKLTVLSRAEEVGDNESQVAASVEGQEAKIAFNSKYLLEALDVLDGDVVLGITTPSSPGVIKPAEGNGYVHVVMPMFVQW